jgi:hypothetical protein
MLYIRSDTPRYDQKFSSLQVCLYRVLCHECFPSGCCLRLRYESDSPSTMLQVVFALINFQLDESRSIPS